MRTKRLAARYDNRVVSPAEFVSNNDEDAAREVVPDDDCPIVDDADDELEKDGNNEDDDSGDDENEDIEQPVDVREQEANLILATRFEEDLRREAENSDGDSADDIWDDDKILDPISEDNEAEIEDDVGREEEEDPDVLLALGKTFNDSVEFKSVLLKYSLKTGYDIKLFLSNELKCGAICSDT